MYIIKQVIEGYDGCYELINPIKLINIKGCDNAYGYISNDMIKSAIDSGEFIDTKEDKEHCGEFIDTKEDKEHYGKTNEHHALRIASLVKLILNGVKVDVIDIYSDNKYSISNTI